jgi:hypothetical protein
MAIGLDDRLLADDALTFNLLHAAVGMTDEPVSA